MRRKFLFLCAFVLSLLAVFFSSCTDDKETYYIEESSTESEVKPLETLQESAEMVVHYLQNVLVSPSGHKKYVSSKTTPATNFSLKEQELKKVAKSEKMSSLAKSYEGYAFAAGTQKGKVVSLYYTRIEVTYSFYDSEGVLKDTVKGIYGLECEAPSVSLGDRAYVRAWNTKADGSGEMLGKFFGATDASFYPKETYVIIGNHPKPKYIGDLVLADGSAVYMDELVAAKKANSVRYKSFKENAIAVIVFNSYNIDSGELDSNTVIGVGLRCVDDAVKSKFKTKWRTSDSDGYMGYTTPFHGLTFIKNCVMVWPSDFVSTDGGESSKMALNYTAMYWAGQYPAVCESGLSITITDSKLKEDWYLPCPREVELLKGLQAGVLDTVLSAVYEKSFADLLGTDKYLWTVVSAVSDSNKVAAIWDWDDSSVETGSALPKVTVEVVLKIRAPGNPHWNYITSENWILPFKVFE